VQQIARNQVGLLTASRDSILEIEDARTKSFGRRMRPPFMRFRWIPFASVAVISWLQGSPASAQERSDSSSRPGPSFWHAAAGVVAANSLTWAYNWYVQRWPWANVGTQSWGRNLRHGFVWDNDCFLDNQLAHPLHGGFYHNSARASGYGFWKAVPFVMAGSASWELFAENVTPSLNDLINTTFGGVAVGEVTYRLSSLLGSKGGRDRNSISRGLGAFALSPMARTQALLSRRHDDSGDAAAAQPEDAASMSLGHRSGHPFFNLDISYGDPFSNPARPYDAFDFRLELGPGVNGVVRRLEISGLLAHHDLSASVRSRSVLGLFQHFEYEEVSTFRFGGQSMSGGLLHEHRFGERTQLKLGVELEGLLLGEISSDHAFYWRRDYDMGPGAGMRLSTSFTRAGRDLLKLEGRVMWLHTVHGSDADHFASFLRAAASVPLRGPLGFGGDVAVTARRSTYGAFPAVTQRVPEVRAYLTWAPN
jgi:hypothetical protein